MTQLKPNDVRPGKLLFVKPGFSVYVHEGGTVHLKRRQSIVVLEVSQFLTVTFLANGEVMRTYLGEILSFCAEQ